MNEKIKKKYKKKKKISYSIYSHISETGYSIILLFRHSEKFSKIKI
jgi:hypothetical protein